MSKSSKRRWRPRYSLKTYLLVCVLVGSGVVWVSHSCHEYLIEQSLIETLVQNTLSQALM